MITARTFHHQSDFALFNAKVTNMPLVDTTNLEKQSENPPKTISDCSAVNNWKDKIVCIRFHVIEKIL